MTRTSKTVLISAALGLSLAFQGRAQIFNRNLIVNGDAESSTSGQPAGSIPGWKTYGSFSVVAYNASGISPTDEGPTDRGGNYFIGGNNATARSYAEQTIRLDGVGAGAKFYFSGFLGMNYGHLDPKVITLTATFMNDQGATVQEAVLNGPANGVDYDIPGGLVLRAMSGFLTTGVTQVKVTIDFGTVTATSINPFAADNISLVLTPEPVGGVNLILNGDAEVPEKSAIPGWSAPRPTADGTPPAPGWNAPTSFTADQYSYWNFGSSQPGPPSAARGKYLLVFNYGGNPGMRVVAYQIVDVPAPKVAGLAKSALNEVIDTGLVTFELDGWLGQYKGGKDPIRVRLSFLDGVKTDPIAAPVELGPVTSQDYTGGSTGMAERKASGSVPVGTRRILVELITDKVSAVTDNVQALADNLSLVLTTPPLITLAGIGNAANYVASKVSAGEIILAYGSYFGPAALAQMQVLNGYVTTTVGETRIYFDGVAAPIIYAVSGVLSCVVPYGAAGKASTQVQVEYKGVKGNTITVPVVAAVPGIFSLNQSGTGQGAILNQDYSVNGASNGAAANSVVMAYATGEGRTDIAVDGQITPVAGPWPAPLLGPWTATVGGIASPKVWYAGSAPGNVAGVFQVNVQIPPGLTPGAKELIIKSGNFSSQSGLTLVAK